MTHSHTPGPWQVDSGMVQTVRTIKREGYDVHIPIAYMDREPGNGTMPVERDANANLIAAAPELLETLQQIANTPCNHGPMELCPRELAQAAIAKAEGHRE